MNNDKVEMIRLVQAIEKYPVLYDNIAQKRKGRIGQTEAWNKVALETKNTPSMCKEKWQAIRSSLVRYLKSNSKKNFYLLEHMQFLIPFLKFRHNDECNYTKEPSPEVNSTCPNSDTSLSTNVKPIKEMEYKIDSEKIKPISKQKLVSSRSKRKYQDLYDDEEDDSDVLFFKSVWTDVKKMNMTQKLQFRISVLNSMEKILCYSEPSSSCSGSKHKSFS